MSKAPMKSSSSSRARLGVVEGEEELIGSPLGILLQKDPAERELDTVRRALAWWKEHLPTAGAVLAPELDAPGDALLEAFRRGCFTLTNPGQRLHEEGEEVRFYTIVLSGRCRLRVKLPPKKDDAEPSNEHLADAQGFVTVETVQQGESIGLIPNENSKSPYDVLCPERSLLLLLNEQDYSVILRQHHRDLQAQTVEFLQRCQAFALATPKQLQSLAGVLRRHSRRRGSQLLRMGEPQRQIWILRTGSCQVSLPPEGAPGGAEEGEEGAAANQAGLDDIEEDRLAHLRTSASLPHDKMLELADKESRLKLLSKYARFGLQKVLKGKLTKGSTKPLGAAEATISVSDAGTLLGDEALLAEGLWLQLSHRAVNSVKAEVASTFFSIDVLNWRYLAQCVKSDQMTENMIERLQRRRKHVFRCEAVVRDLTRERRELRQLETERRERQKLHLPGSVAGPCELDHPDDWLRVALEYRKAPADQTIPRPLSCLEALGLTNLASSPGIDAVCKIFSDPATLKQWRSNIHWSQTGSMHNFKETDSSSNPLGATLSLESRFNETLPPQLTLQSNQLCDQTIRPQLVDDAGQPEKSGGIFFHTELDIEEEQPAFEPKQFERARSSSVPVLPRLTGTSQELEVSTFSTHVESLQASKRPSNSTAPRNPERIRGLRLSSSFSKALEGKSVLLLTDKPDVRKFLLRTVLTGPGEGPFCFVRSSTELWSKLRDTKEQFHALVLDLSKEELQAEVLVKSIRSHPRYAKLPIVVLAETSHLSETVQKCCSFVVYFPLSVSMLKEAMLWCFDRKALRSLVKYEVPDSTVTSMTFGSEPSSKQDTLAVLAGPALFSVA